MYMIKKIVGKIVSNDSTWRNAIYTDEEQICYKLNQSIFDFRKLKALLVSNLMMSHTILVILVMTFSCKGQNSVKINSVLNI